MSHDMPSGANLNPAVHEHLDLYPCLLHIWSQPPLVLMSQGWTKQRKLCWGNIKINVYKLYWRENSM